MKKFFIGCCIAIVAWVLYTQYVFDRSRLCREYAHSLRTLADEIAGPLNKEVVDARPRLQKMREQIARDRRWLRLTPKQARHIAQVCTQIEEFCERRERQILAYRELEGASFRSMRNPATAEKRRAFFLEEQARQWTTYAARTRESILRELAPLEQRSTD